MRIVSLLPAATEILYAIGCGDEVVGVTHECDFPADASQKPILIRPRVDPGAPQADIDYQVREYVARGESIYAVDADLLVRLEPDLIVTQDLCHVCAASPEDLAAALAKLPREARPRVVTFTPHCLDDVWNGIREIGTAAGHSKAAEDLAITLETKVARIAHAVEQCSGRPRTLCLEWFDPPYFAGHWVPEMVHLAGGRDLFGRAGEVSGTVGWKQIVDAQPEVIVLMPCGYDLVRSTEIWRSTKLPPEWHDLPAVKAGRVHVADANAYFSRSGPRLAQGTAFLANLLHPELGVAQYSSGAVAHGNGR